MEVLRLLTTKLGVLKCLFEWKENFHALCFQQYDAT